MRTNGFQSPLSAMQISTWVLFPILFTQFFLFLTPNLPLPLSIPLTILFGTSGILGVYFGYITSKADPMDTKLYEHVYGRPHPLLLEKEKREAEKRRARERRRLARQKRQSERESSIISEVGVGVTSTDEDCIEVKKQKTLREEDEDLEDHKEREEEREEKTKYCWVCQTDVYEESMHCKYCNKCVGKFDHHCMWLNNCVGSANYHLFFRTVISVLGFTSIHVLSLIIYLILYFAGHESTRAKSDLWLRAGAPEVLVGFNIGFLVLTIFMVILVGQLFTFHINLRREQITTYQFIIRDGQRKREEYHLKQKVKVKRGEVVRSLTEQGKMTQVCWLNFMGKNQVCVMCDPIVPMVKKEVEAAATAEDEEDGEDNDHESTGSPGEDEKKSERDSSTRMS